MIAKAPHTYAPEKKLGFVLDALQNEYGVPEQPDRDPLEVLVRGILSQNTSDTNSGRAYDNLRAAFPTWEDIARADHEAITEAIKTGGLADRKARTIQDALQWLQENGDYSLDFLASMDAGDAEASLRQIKGIGVKTARLVLLFGFEMSTFVVDTHVLRVSQRLRLVPSNCGREQAHDLLSDIVPADRTYSAHMNMIEHGRTTCSPRNPKCDQCPLLQWCVHGQSR